eukprot:2553315-Rhodomonas_salina.1
MTCAIARLQRRRKEPSGQGWVGTGVDEDDALVGRADGLVEVHGRPPLLVHNSHLIAFVIVSLHFCVGVVGIVVHGHDQNEDDDDETGQRHQHTHHGQRYHQGPRYWHAVGVVMIMIMIILIQSRYRRGKKKNHHDTTTSSSSTTPTTTTTKKTIPISRTHQLRTLPRPCRTAPSPLQPPLPPPPSTPASGTARDQTRDIVGRDASQTAEKRGNGRREQGTTRKKENERQEIGEKKGEGWRKAKKEESAWTWAVHLGADDVGAARARVVDLGFACAQHTTRGPHRTERGERKADRQRQDEHAQHIHDKVASPTLRSTYLQRRESGRKKKSGREGRRTLEVMHARESRDHHVQKVLGDHLPNRTRLHAPSHTRAGLITTRGSAMRLVSTRQVVLAGVQYGDRDRLYLAVRGSNSVGVEVDPDVAHQQYHAPWYNNQRPRQCWSMPGVLRVREILEIHQVRSEIRVFYRVQDAYRPALTAATQHKSTAHPTSTSVRQHTTTLHTLLQHYSHTTTHSCTPSTHDTTPHFTLARHDLSPHRSALGRTWEGDPLAVGGLPAHVWVHFARDRLPALAHARGQRPLHQARPRAVHLHSARGNACY